MGDIPRSNRCLVTSKAISDNFSSPLVARRCTFSSITLDRPCRLSTRLGCRSILASKVYGISNTRYYLVSYGGG
jgi:hypothetical protein